MAPKTPRTPKTPPSKTHSSIEWKRCPICHSTYFACDKHETACPTISSGQPFTVDQHGFIYGKKFYGLIEEKESCSKCPTSFSLPEKNKMIVLSRAVMELCKIQIGSNVMVEFCGEQETHSILTAWPCVHIPLTSVIITRDVRKMFTDAKNLLRIFPLEQKCSYLTKDVYIKIKEENISFPAEKLESAFLDAYTSHAISNGSCLLLNYLGKKLYLVIEEIVRHQALASRVSTYGLEDALKTLSVKEETPMTSKYSMIIPGTRIHFTNLIVHNSTESSISKSISLSDFGGSCEIVNELKKNCEIIFYSKSIKGNASRGILLYGPSGTGKSLLVRAVANHFKAKLVKILASDVHSKFYGETESRIREKFDEALKSEPCVIFMDEIDVLCPQRGSSSSSSDLERRVVNTLVTMLDSIPKKARVIVFGATNSLGALDRGLRTSGRLDRELEMRVPTVAERKEILDALFRKLPNSLEAQHFEHLASVTHGFVGADLYRLCSRASLVAAKRTLTSFEEGGRNGDISGSVVITFDDTKQALPLVQPTAMKGKPVKVKPVLWTDIGGQEKLKKKIRQMVEWPLVHPDAFKRLGIDPPRGLLMFGPPGCSKTMIAKALATESGLNFILVNGPELLRKYVGESELAVREVFQRARQVAPAIIFFDELDALGSARGDHSESDGAIDRVRSQLLTEMDGITALKDVVIVAATNRPDLIDKALLRPGRIDRMVYVPLPDEVSRREIWKLQLHSKPIHSDVDPDWLVERTQGYSGAEISAVYTEAALQGFSEVKEGIAGIALLRKSHFECALNRVRPQTTAETVALYEYYANGS